ncbi:MAG: hypothetical protein ACWGQW_04160 [bacterium]
MCSDEKRRERLKEIYEEGKRAYYGDSAWYGDHPCPYTAVDEDAEFDAWWNGYYDAAWDD